MAKIIDLYSDLVRIQGLLPESDDILDDAADTLRQSVAETEVSELLQKKYYDGLSTGIYGLSEKIRSIVDDVKPFIDNHKETNGISNADKINIMLLGETSAGKTTFLERIFGGEKCGETGAIPITAFAVIHKAEDLQTPFLEIKFKKEFTIAEDKSTDFDKFLKEYDGFKNCFSSLGKGAYKCESDVPNLYGTEKSDSFVKKANNYYEAFEEIVWHHKKSSKFSKITDFAYFYDMPGSGGMEEHSENLKASLSKYDADIVLYLLKSDQGVSSDYQFLKELKKYTENRNLYFFYQIKNNDSFDQKVEAIKEFVFKDESSDAINPFNEEERQYFSGIQVIDARGGKDDRHFSNIALATVLQKYYTEQAKIFYDTLNTKQNEPKEFKVLEAKPGKDGINRHLRDFLEEINRNCDSENGLPSFKKIKEKFEQYFCLDVKIEDFYQGDLKTTLGDINTQIFNLLSDVLSSCCEGGGLFSERIFSPTKYLKEFKNAYSLNDNYQQLIYLIQAYHFLRLTYQGKLKEIYARKTIDPILNRLKEYINRLKSIENRLSVVRNLITEE